MKTLKRVTVILTLLGLCFSAVSLITCGAANPKALAQEQGPPGAAATVTVGSTTTLTPGSPAKVTNSGTSSAAVLNFSIPQGPQGVQGISGPTGLVGPQGPISPPPSYYTTSFPLVAPPSGWTSPAYGATLTLPAGSYIVYAALTEAFKVQNACLQGLAQGLPLGCGTQLWSAASPGAGPGGQAAAVYDGSLFVTSANPITVTFWVLGLTPADGTPTGHYVRRSSGHTDTDTAITSAIYVAHSSSVPAAPTHSFSRQL